MNRQDIITALQERGYRAEAKDISKNNVMCEAVQIVSDQRVNPVIYTGKIIEDAEKAVKTVEQVAETIIKIYESNKAVTIDADITNPAYIMEHVQIGLQRATQEDICKRTCDIDSNIEEFLFVAFDMNRESRGSIKINSDILKALKIDPVEIWKKAEENTFADCTIRSMAEILGLPEGILPLYVISNSETYQGAGAILNREALKKFAEDHETDRIVVIPSSIHECIIVPHTEELSLDDISSMVQAVNSSEVDTVEQLADKAYIINF